MHLSFTAKGDEEKNFEPVQGKRNWEGLSFEFHTKLHFNLFVVLIQNNEIQKLEAVFIYLK